MIGSIRLSGSAVNPAKALFLKMYVNESAVANQAVTVAVAWQGLSHIPGWDHGHLQTTKFIFFNFFILFLERFYFILFLERLLKLKPLNVVFILLISHGALSVIQTHSAVKLPWASRSLSPQAKQLLKSPPGLYMENSEWLKIPLLRF